MCPQFAWKVPRFDSIFYANNTVFSLELTTKTSKVDCQLADISDRLSSVQTPKFVSSEGYKKISEELAKLMTQHKQARLNNVELQKRLDTHTENLKLFALSLPELTNQVSGKIIDTCEF